MAASNARKATQFYLLAAEVGYVRAYQEIYGPLPDSPEALIYKLDDFGETIRPISAACRCLFGTGSRDYVHKRLKARES